MAGRTLKLPAPAKLNLFLHVLGRRADGYHRLQTVFQLLDRGDELEFTPRADGAIVCHGELPGVAAQDNLIWRAAQSLQQAGGAALGAEIRLEKRLPLGGGLGGGSSNAATCLLALNRLWGLDWTLDRLAALGLTLGADVPLFVRGHSAFAEGVGEQLAPVDLAPAWYCILTPDCMVSTAAIFNDPELTRDTAPTTISAFVADPEAGHNDCWPVVAQRYPPVLEAFQWLSQFGEARLTGTGASVFLALPTKAAAQRVAARSPLPALVARGVNISPLHAALSESTGA